MGPCLSPFPGFTAAPCWKDFAEIENCDESHHFSLIYRKILLFVYSFLLAYLRIESELTIPNFNALNGGALHNTLYDLKLISLC